jgi:hypothetical protein
MITFKTHNSSHEMRPTAWKANKKNNGIKFSIKRCLAMVLKKIIYIHTRKKIQVNLD